MTLRAKTLVVILLALLGLVGTLYRISSSVVLQGYLELEARSMRQHVLRAQQALDDDIDGLHSLAVDWGSWNELYAFIETRDQTFLESNFSDLGVLQLDAVLLTDVEGTPVFASGMDRVLDTPTPFPDQLLALTRALDLLLGPGEQLVKASVANGRAGLVLAPEGAWLVAAQPILPSEGRGAIRGTLLMWRRLDDAAAARLERGTRLPLHFDRLDDPTLTPDLVAVAARADSDDIVVEPRGEDNVVGYATLRGLDGQPALLLSVTAPRDIYAQGLASQHVLIGSVAVVGVVFVAIMLALLEWLVLARLARVGETVRRIGEEGDLSLRVNEAGEDELGRLGGVLNATLDSLADLRAAEGRYLAEIEDQRAESERLLLNVLPRPIAERLKQSSDVIADDFPAATVLFIDLVGFTAFAATRPSHELVALLNRLFSTFDRLADRHGLEKIKTIGDAYMAVAGLPVPRADHVEAIADMALDALDAMGTFNREGGYAFELRIGIHTGPVVAGVIGLQRFIYDLWGDTVNIASRMESQGINGRIQVSDAVRGRLGDRYRLEERGTIEVKGIGPMRTWFLVGRRGEADGEPGP